MPKRKDYLTSGASLAIKDVLLPTAIAVPITIAVNWAIAISMEETTMLMLLNSPAWNVISCCIVVIIVLVYILIRTRGGRTEQDIKIDNLITGQAQLMAKIDNLTEEVRVGNKEAKVGNKELTRSINNLVSEIRADREARKG